MEAEKEQGLFASIVKLCQPTASQESQFPNCPLAREFETFADSDSDHLPSSPDPTPPERTGIMIVSPPDSPNSSHQQVEDDALFHTPPEHHFRSTLSSSEDQNLDGEDAEGMKVVVQEVEAGGSKNVRASDGESEDQPGLKKVRVAAEKFDGETVPVGETEAIEIEETEGVRDTEIIGVGNSVSDEQEVAVNLADNSLDAISEYGTEVCKIELLRKVDQLLKDGIPKVDANGENHESRKECEHMENITSQNSASNGTLDSFKSKEESMKLQCAVGNQRGSGKGSKVAEDKHGTHVKSIEEIDRFRYVSRGEDERRNGRRQLPVSMNGNKKNPGDVNEVKKFAVLEFLDVLKVVVGDMNDECAGVNLLETAKRRGLTFPQVRWWPPEGDDC